MRTQSESDMLHRMAAYCSTAERCVQDVRKKIQTAGLPDEAAERIVDSLVKEKFIDEDRFARSFVNDKLHFNQWGRIKISYELEKKNIPPSLRSEAIAGIDEADYQAILFSLLKEKMKTMQGKDEQEIFARLFRFAAGRGFESRETMACLHRLFKGNGDADGRE
jgi:regulatory protein